MTKVIKKWQLNKKFHPKIKPTTRISLLKGWSVAIKRTLIT